MKNPKISGISLISASFALLVCVLYDPSNIVSALRLNNIVNEAVVVIVAMTLIAIGTVSGAILFFTSRTRSHPVV